MESIKSSEGGFEFLVEKEAMWAQTLMQALEGNGIPCTALPVHGAGLVMKTGMRERMKVYVAPEKRAQAEEIVEELFAGSED